MRKCYISFTEDVRWIHSIKLSELLMVDHHLNERRKIGISRILQHDSSHPKVDIYIR